LRKIEGENDKHRHTREYMSVMDVSVFMSLSVPIPASFPGRKRNLREEVKKLYHHSRKIIVRVYLLYDGAER